MLTAQDRRNLLCLRAIVVNRRFFYKIFVRSDFIASRVMFLLRAFAKTSALSALRATSIVFGVDFSRQPAPARRATRRQSGPCTTHSGGHELPAVVRPATD